MDDDRVGDADDFQIGFFDQLDFGFPMVVLGILLDAGAVDDDVEEQSGADSFGASADELETQVEGELKKTD